MRITVFGSGNGGVTAAYHFAKKGHEVCIYDFQEFDVQINAIKKSGGIEALKEVHGCTMILDGFEKNVIATHNIEEAVRFAETYVMICPSFAQELFFEKMIPYLNDGCTLITMPANYAGLVFTKMLEDRRMGTLDIHFVDTISIPWACRLVKPATTSIMGIKKFMPLSIYPKDRDGRIKRIVEEVLPIPAEVLENPLAAGLENINFGGHPLMTTVNIGLLENFNGEFNYYKDCCSPATARASAKMDLERLSIGKSFGIKLRTELEMMNSLYGLNETSVYDFNRKSEAHIKVNSAPSSSKSRYISEDVPYILVPCFEMARLCKLDVPILTSCIYIASAYNDENYFETGRGLKKMGLDNMSIKEILNKISK